MIVAFIVRFTKEIDMQKEQGDKSARNPAASRDDVPPPEQGSPGEDTDNDHDEAARRIEKGKDKDPNPLAPPVNTQAGS
ncbi:hypothetical protein [Sphingobium sp. CFD-1]|uniref:hypothetical protein n=1 Tax=Sphingobium sp. CFD-1 TaxID=2878545 RepID=UPI00214B57EB|nr:hypothetical protein [Sphingobium sp. CFD-1]